MTTNSLPSSGGTLHDLMTQDSEIAQRLKALEQDRKLIERMENVVILDKTDLQSVLNRFVGHLGFIYGRLK